MQEIIPAVRSLLKNDPELSKLVSDVRYFRIPRKPQSLIKPVVVLNFQNFRDKPGGHGANILAMLEVTVWAYDKNNDQPIVATKAANTVGDILTTSRVEIPGGGSTRLSLNAGFQNISNAQDANTIQLEGRFIFSYWSPSRITRLQE